MAKMILTPGGELDLVTPADLQNHLDKQTRAIHQTIREEIRGVKHMRFRGQGNLSAATSTVVIDGPQGGYAWSIRRISILGATSQPVNFFRTTDGVSSQNWNFVAEFLTIPDIQIFSSNSCILLPDESMLFTPQGATPPGQVWIGGEAVEVPAEMLGKLLL